MMMIIISITTVCIYYAPYHLVKNLLRGDKKNKWLNIKK